MVIALARSQDRILRKGLRSFSKSTLNDVNTLLCDAFSSASGLPPLPVASSNNLEEFTGVASIMHVFQDTFFENCCRVKDALYVHHLSLCGSLDVPTSALNEKLFIAYRRLGYFEDAVYFCSTVKPNIFQWNGLISGCLKNGSAIPAFQLFQTMKLEEILPDGVTFVLLLKACSSLDEGRLLHFQAIEYISDLNVFVMSTLVDIYAKQGSIADAYHVFETMQERTLVTWSVMIAGFAEAGQNEQALNTYQKMQNAKFQPNEITFINILRACTCALYLDITRKIHSDVIEGGYGAYLVVANALIDAYAKCRSLEDAYHVFTGMRGRNVVSWTSLIQGYAHHGHIENTLKLFWQMEKHGVNPNAVTLASILKLCATNELLSCGEQIHNYILMESKENVVFVQNCLLDMYIKWGRMKAAQCVFDKMSQHDVISFSTLINGYAQYEQSHKAFTTFKRMMQDGVEPNEVTYVGLLQACSAAGHMEKGRMIHDHIIRGSLETHLVIGNALMDMYSKLGNVKAAHGVFNKMSKRDLVSWNSLLAAYCQHGHTIEAFELFRKMTEETLEPDHFTFLSLLSVCSYSGLLAEGRRYFEIMTKEYKIKPNAEHCACMVDLLGRAGCVHEALEMINKSTVDSVMVWNVLLGACKISGDVEIAEIATKNILKLDPKNTAACVLLSNIYAAARKGGKGLEGDRKEDYQLLV
ncbi:hypothetical protein GOP47_0025171 [Adiantum capillus-veneris]|uniref:Pentatricopeptide repeat-containing protein n=1 Tax=Adiantum capillus-veneris TaxID=13818 RepID=A0A9D4U5R3_ADICA|nr:hypothetical protein GOP47_0025171 [Adiantum capillus-veneris]